MEFLLAIILCIFWPLRFLIQCFVSKKTSKKPHLNESPSKICKDIMRDNMHDHLLWASSQNYTDMWTRDTFFACMSNIKLQKIVSEEFSKYQRSDGLIPLYIGKGNACCKLFCNKRPEGKTRAFYTDAKSGDEPTDSCFQFIIMAWSTDPQKCILAWNYMQKYVRHDLIYESGLGTWQDTIKHCGAVAYTNILYYRATQLLFPDSPSKAERIKSALIQTLWNGSYFVCSTTNSSFGQVDNALALLYKIAPNVDSIFNIHNTFFSGDTAPPNLKIHGDVAKPAFSVFDIYLPCWPIGNAKYHNGWSWSWVNLLFMKAKKTYGRPFSLKYYQTMIHEYGTLHETYDSFGPIRRILYTSQPDFSESCGLYLEVDQNFLIM